MRVFLKLASVLVLGLFSTQASAASQSFCEQVAKHYAHANSSNVDTWLKDYQVSLSNCTAQIEPAVKVKAPPIKPAQKLSKRQSKKVVIVPARSSEFIGGRRSALLLEPGSIAWNNFCTAKYPSFNKLTGYYKSKNGQQKRCRDGLH